MGHARALVAIDDLGWQKEVFIRIRTEGLSVRNTEELAQARKSKSKSSKQRAILSFDEQKVQADLRLKFGKQVVLRTISDGAGKIEIPYDSADDLDVILRSLDL